MNWPEIQVTRRGPMITRVAWDPKRMAQPLAGFDMTGMGIATIEARTEAGKPPLVMVTFEARLVEVEEQ